MGVSRGVSGRVLPMAMPGRAPGLCKDATGELAVDLSERAVRTINELFCGDTVDGESGKFAEAHHRSYGRIFSQASRMADSFDPEMTAELAFSSIGGGLDYRGTLHPSFPWTNR